MSQNELPAIRIDKDGKRMILIPAGWFAMGSEEHQLDESPIHSVYLDAYYIDETPVTNAEYKKYMDATGYHVPEGWDENRRTFPNGQDDHPVVRVTWEDANAYASWAGKQLSSEAQWEKAARGTDERRYPWGNEQPDATRCNFNHQEKGTTPVSKYSPRGDSPYGVKEMAGNVWEWCADWYYAYYYKDTPTRNPTGPVSGDNRVVRGGSWQSTADNVRVANREKGPMNGHWDLLGFRCVE